jgi:dTDP-4-amino-4,6-dideoxygalactose transaminase
LKSIDTAADLALLGAPPAFERLLHVGRPNVGDEDRFLELTREILGRRWFSNYGPVVQELEQRISDRLGVKHCIAMCNGTVALEIAIRALGLTGEVIVPSYTFVATAHALQWQQITPIFADIDAGTHTLNPDAVRRMITPRTTGIIGVHLWGRACDVDGLAAVAADHRLELLFDAAHAFDCSYGREKIGGFGRCEVLSFHATKFFNTFEGGAVVTNDDDLAKRMRLMVNFGFSGFDNVIYPGTNGKMTEVCAAMGLANLENLDSVVAVNRSNYEQYRDGLAGIPSVRLLAYDEAEHNNYQYVVVELGDAFPISRDEVVAALHAENVLARRYFWPGCHRMEPYRSLFPHAGLTLPNTALVADRVIVLPTGTAVSQDDIKTITRILAVLATRGVDVRAHLAERG